MNTLIPADYQERIDRLKKALADGRIATEPPEPKKNADGSFKAGHFDLAGLIRSIERGFTCWSVLGTLDVESDTK